MPTHDAIAAWAGDAAAIVVSAVFVGCLSSILIAWTRGHIRAVKNGTAFESEPF